MKVMAFNGSPRRNWNTARLLESALEGALSKGAEVELVNLYDMDLRGCSGCMACKVRDGRSLGRCARKDALSPVLERAHEADALILGSPIYFGDVTGCMRNLMERLFFQYHNYEDYGAPLSPPKRTALFYTMNVSEEQIDSLGYRQFMDRDAGLMRNFFGHCVSLCSTETLQVNDYSRYHLANFDEAQRRQRHETVFAEDCRRAYGIGAELASL